MEVELAGVGVNGVGADVVDGLCLIQLGKVVADQYAISANGDEDANTTAMALSQISTLVKEMSHSRSW